MPREWWCGTDDVVLGGAVDICPSHGTCARQNTITSLIHRARDDCSPPSTSSPSVTLKAVTSSTMSPSPMDDQTDQRSPAKHSCVSCSGRAQPSKHQHHHEAHSLSSPSKPSASRNF